MEAFLVSHPSQGQALLSPFTLAPQLHWEGRRSLGSLFQQPPGLYSHGYALGLSLR